MDLETHYFTGGGNSTAFIGLGIDSNGDPLPYVIPTDEFGDPMVEVDLATYNAAVDAREAYLDTLDQRGKAYLQYSPSKFRTPAYPLDGAYIVAGTQLAIFVEDQPDLGITQVEFKLNGASYHTETSAPWDANGTDGFGDAIRVAAGAGSFLIEAVITASTGDFTVSANIEVE